MASVYKKFTAQDYATVPFNAHKQYKFIGSASADSNQVKYYSARWTSESISLFTSSSSAYESDVYNVTKYYQIDHLFYRNFKRDLTNRFGYYHYNNQKRVLYEKANIISVPTGHYGHSIKKGTFLVSASRAPGGVTYSTLIDDSNGNLIVSGSVGNVSNYETDIKTNVLNLGPVNGFKRYDLNTYDGYVRIDGYKDTTFWRRGKDNPNIRTSYTTPKFGDEFDDSYYFN